ncbi:hypothetical protein EDC34_10174 [Thermomonas haemolytica]|uniref:DUF4124 domain-containing protein n=2 Tax=Thermomonas haemolytica TaxID=141949 RepID=A0A4R3N8M6_9GAMM|nr:hypothetical protein EDC34_10174 [Thermomonas haemolytica]TNY29705.1 hypothetical protein BV505_03650 [Thermomonas haemolytica]
MRRWMLALLLLVCTQMMPARAEQLYRCLARDGAVSYQAQPCAATMRLDRVVEYRPEPVISASQATAGLRQAPVKQHRSVKNPRRHRAAATASDRCRAAQAGRSAALEQLGLKRTYAQLSRLDAKVRAACPRG